jgi:arylformamidase
MKIYDVTVAVSENVPIYEGDPRVIIEGVKSIAGGDGANVSNLCFGAHTGTHVDAPNHFIDGTARIGDLDLEKLVGTCRVIEVADDVIAIDASHLDGAGGAERVLFKTRNSAFWNEPSAGFRTDFTYITPEAALKLADADVKLVGIDYLSVEKFGSTDFSTHITLLKNEIVILEGLDLREVAAGDYEIFCLPLKYAGATGDGAPARTILRAL